jgi:hypothetical protein
MCIYLIYMTETCEHELVRNGKRRNCQRPVFRNGDKIESWCKIHRCYYFCSGKEETQTPEEG